jgi:methanethiol S-methyltransferase
MVKRLAFFTYGSLAYVVFLGTFLYAIAFAIAFVGGFLAPTTLDGAADGALFTSLLIDAGLLAVFAIQHSVMARPWFKQWWTRIIPSTIERSTYVLCASLALLLLFWQWRPLGGVLWSLDSTAAQIALRALSASGWVLVLVVTFLINHFDLFGLRQVWFALKAQPYTQISFRVPGPYRVVRHPLYFGFLLAFWMTPTMTLAHLFFAVMTTAYIVIAIQFEEHDLVAEHGAVYDEYRQRVPMLVPGIGAVTARRSTAALDVTAPDDPAAVPVGGGVTDRRTVAA